MRLPYQPRIADHAAALNLQVTQAQHAVRYRPFRSFSRHQFAPISPPWFRANLSDGRTTVVAVRSGRYARKLALISEHVPALIHDVRDLVGLMRDHHDLAALIVQRGIDDGPVAFLELARPAGSSTSYLTGMMMSRSPVATTTSNESFSWLGPSMPGSSGFCGNASNRLRPSSCSLLRPACLHVAVVHVEDHALRCEQGHRARRGPEDLADN